MLKLSAAAAAVGLGGAALVHATSDEQKPAGVKLGALVFWLGVGASVYLYAAKGARF